jgi:hypothetical protein
MPYVSRIPLILGSLKWSQTEIGAPTLGQS